MSTPKKQCMESILAVKKRLEAINKPLMAGNPKLGPLHRGVINYPGGEPRANTTRDSFSKSILGMRKKLAGYLAEAMSSGADEALKAYKGNAELLIGEGNNGGLWGKLWILAQQELASKK